MKHCETTFAMVQYAYMGLNAWNSCWADLWGWRNPKFIASNSVLVLNSLVTLKNHLTMFKITHSCIVNYKRENGFVPIKQWMIITNSIFKWQFWSPTQQWISIFKANTGQVLKMTRSWTSRCNTVVTLHSTPFHAYRMRPWQGHW